MVGSSFNFGKYADAKHPNGYSNTVAPRLSVAAKPKPPARKPDAVVSETTLKEQAALYRLSGDYNPLHIKDDLGKALGFKGAILHGLSSYGFAARAIVKSTCLDDPTRFKGMSARFTSPVMPGGEF